jgi:2-C-methyl-D-erythritol 4-phosphate cytidylyltransferase
MRTAGLIVAGGSGDRFGGEIPKQLVHLEGEPILTHTVRAVSEARLDRLVVVAHPAWIAETAKIVASPKLEVPVEVVGGGATRSESTRNGLAALDVGDDEIIVVHDAVRPLVLPDLILRSIEPILAGHADATCTVIASPDTLVTVDGEVLDGVPDRNRLRRAQTPQTFRARVLALAHERASAAGVAAATDDCGLVLRHVPEARVAAVVGDEANIKITTPLDLVVAEHILRMRIGTPAAPADEPRG